MTAKDMNEQKSVQQRRNVAIALAIVTIVILGISVNFFIAGSIGIISFTDYRDKLLIPSVFAIAAIAIYSHYWLKPLSNRLLTGLWVGAVATLALEAIRIPSYAILHWLPGDDMIMMPGAFLVGLAPSPMALMQMMQSGAMAGMPQSAIMTALVAGALYHFWNGATLGAVYTIFAGKTRWHYALVWAFIIHIGMMLAPWLIMMFGTFGVNYNGGYTIFTASLIAHLVYGSVLGVLASRFVRERGILAARKTSMEAAR
jgi:hypothetical protein